MTSIDGTYSIAASGIGGSSVAICTLRDGRLEGWDLGGARYKGTFSVDGDVVTFSLEMTMPPGGFAIWGTAEVDVWHSRAIDGSTAISNLQDGVPFRLNKEGTWLIMTRIPDELEALAGPDGLESMIAQLTSTLGAWAARGAR
jgi:hypothetical protein